MAIPKLSATDRKSWETIQNLEDDDLYAMLGAEPAYYQPSSTPEYLLLEFRFNKTKQTIARGKKRIRLILDASRDMICKRWKSVKKQAGAFDRAGVVAIVSEVVKRFLDLDPSLPVVPTVDLICRYCTYNLDTLCEKKQGRNPEHKTIRK